MVMHPVGPLPASTYWRRRALLLVGLLVLLLVLRSCAGGTEPTRTSAKPIPTPTSSTTSGTKVTPTRSPSPATTTPSTGGVLCADSVLGLSASTDAEVYAVGGTPKITLVVKNNASAPCRRDIGSGAVELLVFSGADRVWSSDDCSLGKASALTTFAAGGTQAIVKTWPGQRSAPGCGGSKAQAKAGTYRVVARVGTLRVEGAVFRFRS